MHSETDSAASPALEASGLTRRFGDVVALERVSLTVKRGEFFSLLGPSGCGKTTLLRLVAGLDLPDEGSLKIAGKDAGGLPAHQRNVNTVFQSYALFPHMTAEENVGFGLRVRKVPASQIRERVGRAMEITQITELAGRFPAQLSGGQKQRVALARAIVNEPAVLLLDEPLGALDLKLRKQLQGELHALQRRLGITFIYVTHDQDEALTMSDRIAVMNAGRIEQLDAPATLYERPRTRFVAQFLGSCNLLEGIVSKADTGTLVVETRLGPLRAVVNPDEAAPPARGRCILGFRPEKLRWGTAAATAAANSFPARILSQVYSGAETTFQLEAAGCTIHATALNADGGGSTPRAGETVQCVVPPESLILLCD